MKSHPEVPEGDYCYAYGNGKALHCPHMTTKVVNGVTLAFCGLLQMGSIPNGTTEEEYEKLKEHYGTTEDGMLKDHPDTDLFLLWDSCKECGVNTEMRGYSWETNNYSKSYPHHTLKFRVKTSTSKDFYVLVRISKTAKVGENTNDLAKKLRKLSSYLQNKFSPVSLSFIGLRDSNEYSKTSQSGLSLDISQLLAQASPAIGYCANIVRSIS